MPFPDLVSQPGDTLADVSSFDFERGLDFLDASVGLGSEQPGHPGYAGTWGSLLTGHTDSNPPAGLTDPAAPEFTFSTVTHTQPHFDNFYSTDNATSTATGDYNMGAVNANVDELTAWDASIDEVESFFFEQRAPAAQLLSSPRLNTTSTVVEMQDVSDVHDPLYPLPQPRVAVPATPKDDDSSLCSGPPTPCTVQRDFSQQPGDVANSTNKFHGHRRTLSLDSSDSRSRGSPTPSGTSTTDNSVVFMLSSKNSVLDQLARQNAQLLAAAKQSVVSPNSLAQSMMARPLFQFAQTSAQCCQQSPQQACSTQHAHAHTSAVVETQKMSRRRRRRTRITHSVKQSSGRASNACVDCRRSKVKCDNQRPCGRCVKRGQQHTCRDSVHKKRGRKRATEDVLQMVGALPPKAADAHAHAPTPVSTEPMATFNPYGYH